MATDGNLTTQQHKAIAALMVASDILTAAQLAGVGERTLHRWLKEDADFQAALRTAETDAVAGAVRRLVGAADSAVTALVDIMQGNAAASVRLRAAIALLDQLTKLRQLTDLEARIATLEGQLQSEGEGEGGDM